MIRKTAKGILSLVTALYFVFLTLFGLGDALYPDTLHQPVGEEVRERLCFSFEEGEAVSSNALDCRVLAFGVIPVKNVRVNFYDETQVFVGGDLFGVRMHTKGLLVSALDKVETAKGSLSPGEAAGIEKGDVLLEADGVVLSGAADLVKIVSRSGGNPVTIRLDRGGKELSVILHPALSADGGGYKAGLWVRDGAAGIGTVTFRMPDSGAFAGLGHAVCDAESGKAFPLGTGSVCEAVIDGIKKGENGDPGELRGHLSGEDTGRVLANTPCGIYGTAPLPQEGTLVSLGHSDRVKPGKASIFCTLDGRGKMEYEIQIEEIIGKDRETKNFVVRVTDPTLLKITGGIVQGMSGSPILQDGKLIGAVTHVLVGDPTRGYGIFIENMMANMPE